MRPRGKVSKKIDYIVQNDEVTARVLQEIGGGKNERKDGSSNVS